MFLQTLGFVFVVTCWALFNLLNVAVSPQVTSLAFGQLFLSVLFHGRDLPCCICESEGSDCHLCKDFSCASPFSALPLHLQPSLFLHRIHLRCPLFVVV